MNNKLLGLLATILTATAVQARADLIRIDATGTVDDPFGSAYIAVGTTVTASVEFNVTGLTPYEAVFSDVSGMFSWNDGTSRTFNATGLGVGVAGGTSFVYELRFTGTGPTINGYAPSSFDILMNLTESPFTSTTPIGDLLLDATVAGMGFAARSSTSGSFGCALCVGGDVSASVSRVTAVPEPGTLALFGIGLAALGLSRRRRKI